MNDSGRIRVVSAALGVMLAACGGQIGSPATEPFDGVDGGHSVGPTGRNDGGGPFKFDVSIPTMTGDANPGGPFDGGPPGEPDVVEIGPPEASTPDASVPPSVDAGCTPTLPTGFVASPKGVATAACTPEQIAATVQGCFLDGATDSTCTPFAQGPCWACIETPSSSGTWGAYVAFNEDFYDDNYGGCIARLDPSAPGVKCGAAYAEFEECLDQACAASCPPDDSSTNPYAALQACENTAAGAGCATYQDAEEVACADEESVMDQCSAILNGEVDGGVAQQIGDYINVICGVPAAVDAGVDGG